MTVLINDCKTLCTRARDLARHKRDTHTNKKVCTQCTSTFARKDSLDLHIYRTHLNPTTKKDSQTQTALNMEEDNLIDIHISRISAGIIHTLPIKPVRITPPALLLNNSDLSLFCKQNETEKNSIRKTCGFKRSLSLRKQLNRTNKDLQKYEGEYIPEDLDTTPTFPTYTLSPIEVDESTPGTSGCDRRQSNYSLHNSTSEISFKGLDNSLTASASSLDFINNIMSLDFEEKELNEATEELNNTLMNDLKCSSSESSMSDYYIDEKEPCS